MRRLGVCHVPAGDWRQPCACQGKCWELCHSPQYLGLACSLKASNTHAVSAGTSESEMASVHSTKGSGGPRHALVCADMIVSTMLPHLHVSMPTGPRPGQALHRVFPGCSDPAREAGALMK